MLEYGFLNRREEIKPSTQVGELASDREDVDNPRTQMDEKAEYRGADAGRRTARGVGGKKPLEVLQWLLFFHELRTKVICQGRRSRRSAVGGRREEIIELGNKA